MEAKKRNLPILHRSDVLAEILNHADGVAVQVLTAKLLPVQ